MQRDGFIAIHKPKGMTSHDVVFKLRKVLKTKKIGHTGTLDPEVDGVLVLCIGKATKLSNYLMASQKIYRGEITLGISTETEDAHGAVVEKLPVESPIEETSIDQAMAQMTGKIQQIPPMYSAVKVNGRRLYEYAREGLIIDRPVRTVKIESFERISDTHYFPDTKTQSWQFDVTCGKGTYVRTLAVDLGKYLGFPAHMSDLTRSKTSGFTIDDAIALDELLTMDRETIYNHYLHPMSMIKTVLPSVTISNEQLFAVTHGQVVDSDFFKYPIEQTTAIFNEQEQLLALYSPHPEKEDKLKPVKVFPDSEVL